MQLNFFNQVNPKPFILCFTFFACLPFLYFTFLAFTVVLFYNNLLSCLFFSTCILIFHFFMGLAWFDFLIFSPFLPALVFLVSLLEYFSLYFIIFACFGLLLFYYP